MKALRDHLHERLSERDWQILASIRQFRFLTTRQLARTHFDVGLDQAIPRRVNHALARLKTLGIVTTLERRIGGVRAGSAGYVWTATDAGARLLATHDGASTPTRIRTYEPSTTFLAHTLAVADVAIAIAEATRGGAIDVAELQTEPEAWRTYVGPMGGLARLKPDLAVVTLSGGFEDRWFVEVDLDTEPPSRVLAKCRLYEQYRGTSIEQQQHGVFPGVVWIVPSLRRATQLRTHIGQELAISAKLFAVASVGDIAAVVQHGLTAYNNQASGRKGGHPS